jgi:hypothetical protein
MALARKEAKHASGQEEVNFGTVCEVVRCDAYTVSEQRTGEIFHFALPEASKSAAHDVLRNVELGTA